MTVKPVKISKIRVRPTCPARLAAAMLRRAFARPILAAPPVRAIQASHLLQSKVERERIVLNYEAKLVYKEKNYWLVLTRTLLAGFNAPIDICNLDIGQETLFKTKFNYRKWRKICKKAGLVDLKFHDLRKTFCSLLAQNGVSTAVTQRLLEHSSPNLTNKVYTNVDPVLRYAVEQLHVGKWL